MSLATRHGLPVSLTGQLSDAALSLVNETARENRFKVLAQQLNITEAALLNQLAQATGLTILEEPAIDLNGIKILPARLASETQVVPVLITGAEEGRINLISPPPARQRHARLDQHFFCPSSEVVSSSARTCGSTDQ